jgi:chromosome segregation ATPase
VERARWTDERLDDRMSAIDTTFERVFEEMRAERQEFRAEMRAISDRLELRIDRFEQRIDQVDERLRQLDERLGRIGFRAAGILAVGLIALVATQL